MKHFLVGLGALCATVVTADINWSAETNPILGPDVPGDRAETSFATPLLGDAFSAASGYFVQLIYAGPNGVIDPIPASVSPDFGAGTGVQSDDVIKSVRWIGAGRFVFPADPAFTNGKWDSGNPVSDDPNGKYYVRAWAGISPDSTIVQAGGVAARIPAAYTDASGPFWWYGDSGLVDYVDVSGADLVAIDFTQSVGFSADQLVTAQQEKPEILDLLVALPDVTITWVSMPAGSYDIEATSVLTNALSWTALQQDIGATETNTTVTVGNITADDLYFRVIPSP
ncbi:MAG: hypothetical protein ACI9TH_003351 [Kiritimatiellia bacterium]|jgi:hypothetical protein